MSGLKRSEVSFREELARAAAARAGAQRAVADSRAMLRELSAAIAGCRDTGAFTAVLDRSRAILADAEAASGRAQRLLRRWKPALTDIQNAVADCKRVQDRLRDVGKEVQTAHTNLGVHAELAGLTARLEAQAESLGRWDAGFLDALLHRCRQEAGRVAEDTRHGKATAQSRQAVCHLRADLAQFNQSVRRREEQEEARNTILAAFDASCHRLGYTVEHETQHDPNAARRFHVNTGAYGVITFELSLDAVLRTTCPIVQPRICEDWVERFEEQMSRLGVALDFRYVETGQPVRRGKAARGIGAPQQNAQQAER